MLQPALSDQEMLSQTETEDTDSQSGDIPTVSCKNITDSGTVDSSQDSSSSGESTNTSSIFDDKKQACVSVDLTEVTELEENSSAVDEFTEDMSSRHKNRKHSSAFPDWTSSPDWYKHDCFKAYWKHYEQVMSWCKKHNDVYSKLTKKYPSHNTRRQQMYSYYNDPYPYPPSWFHPYYMTGYNTSNTGFQNYSSSEGKTRRSKKKQRKRRTKSDHELTCSETQTETSEEYEMVITPEMLEFFVKTQEHRKQRDEAKKAENGKDAAEPEHINVEDLAVTAKKVPTVEAPKEQPGARRTSEMKLLYGKGAAMIHGMETALQMTFDRNTDLKQPKFWPNMPLKVVFK